MFSVTFQDILILMRIGIFQNADSLGSTSDTQSEFPAIRMINKARRMARNI